MTANTSTSTSTSGTKSDGIFPPPLVTETLQYRLETGNIAKQGGQRGSLTRCAQKFGIFQSNLLAEKADAEAIETSKQDLVQDLELCKLELYKLILLQRNLAAQVERNQTAEEDRQKEIDKWSELVQSGQSQASNAKLTKRCFLEYEALAKMTNENHPQSSRALKEQLAVVQNEIDMLKEEKAATDYMRKVRESQFHLLIQYMMDLKRSINDTEEQGKILNGAKESTGKSVGASEGDKEEEVEVESMDVDDDDEEEEEGLYGDLGQA